MQGEDLAGLISIAVCGLIITIIGITQFRSKKPVTFWTGEKCLPVEKVIDMETYNKKHGVMWILYGVGMVVAYLIGYFLKSEIAMMVALLIESCGGVILMIIFHNHLYNKYVKK